MSSSSSFNVLLINSDTSSNSGYQEILKEIPNCKIYISESFLPYEELIKQKKVDAIFINIKNLPADLTKDLSLVKKQFKDYGVPTIFFRQKSSVEVIPDSIINTSFTSNERILIKKLIIDLKEHSLNDEEDIELTDNSGVIVNSEHSSSTSKDVESNELNQQRAIFIRNIIYEIRTLLNNVGGPIQLIKEKIDDPELIPFFGIIDTTLSRMVQFTFKATLSSDLKTGSYPIKKSMINLEETVRFSVLELTEFIELERIKLTVNSPSSKTMLYADKDLLFHCFNAILDKTVNLTKENGEIVIDFSVYDDRIDCKINSNSITFPKGEILEIFNSSSIDQEIGLTLAKIVLTIHNASYWVDVAKENGVTIGITFKTTDHE